MFRKCSWLQRATILITALFVICGIVAFAGVSASQGLFVPVAASRLAGIRDVTVDQPGVASCAIVDGGLQITALDAGQTGICAGDDVLAVVECMAGGFLVDHVTGQYTGAGWVQGAILVFLLGTVAVLVFALRGQQMKAFYNYATPLLVALLLLAVMVLAIVAVRIALPDGYVLENALSGMPTLLLMFTLPVMVVFALSMLVSNLSLLRHEGRTWRNLLGSMIGFALSLVTLAIMFNTNASGSLADIHLHDLIINFLSGVVLWTVCKLIGIILCGTWAARGKPAMDKDYVLILGCKLSRKGGLTPLLRGRVDRALSFARQQEAETGHMPVLIPCGGKGRDELRSEAAAMREYLLEQGVPESGILVEDRSVNTWENIRNAQAMMTPEARVAYATTNYHVFRAGVWADRNGLKAEGMGSRTKWYYWPNAFMREYVALIAANLPHELLMIALIGIQSGLLAYLYR